MSRFAVPLSLSLLVAVATLDVPSASAATPRGMRILHHEALQDVSGDSGGRELQFDAYGRRFTLQLERNERIGFVSPARTPGVEALRGTLQSSGSAVQGSWARITRTPAGLFGMFSDGHDLYAIEPANEAAGHVVGTLAASGSEPVIYRLADTLLPPGEASCGTAMSLDTAVGNGEPTTALQQFQQVASELQALPATVASRQLQVAVVGDNEFAALTFNGGLTPEAAIAARFNTVDGIFSTQIGVRILVADVNVFRTTDPFTDTTAASTLLDELATWRQATTAQNTRGLTHLLTGKDLDGTTVGIAFVGSLCRARSGAGLSQGNLSAANSALVIAHEMGHNFGAVHDGEAGTACASTANTFLMAPSLNGSSTFSQCSIDSITPVVAAASCLTPLSVSDADFDLPAPARQLRGTTFSYAFNVRSVGGTAVDGVAVNITLPAALATGAGATVAGGAACTAAGNVLSCSVGSIAAGASKGITLTTSAAQAGTFAVNLALTSTNDAVAVNNNGQVSFGIDPSADLAVSLSASPVSFTTGSTSQVTATVNEVAGDAVSDAALSFDVPAGLTVTAVAANSLGCTLLNAAVSCVGGALTAGTNRAVVLTVSAQQAGTRQLGASVRATVGDPVSGNNSAQLSLETTNPPAASGGGGGGGGGALDAATLLGLAVALALALRRRVAGPR